MVSSVRNTIKGLFWPLLQLPFGDNVHIMPFAMRTNLIELNIFLFEDRGNII